MNFSIYCNSCSSELDANLDMVGQVLNCPNCENLVKVSKPKPAPVTEDYSQFKINCLTKPYKKDDFTLLLSTNKAQLIQNDELLFELSLQEFTQISEFPNLNQAWYLITIGDQLLKFKVSKSDLKGMRVIVDGYFQRNAPEAMAKEKTMSLLKIFFGGLLIIAGIAITVLSYGDAAKGKSPTYVIWYGAIIAGLVMLCKGISGFVRLQNAEDRAKGK